MMKSLIRSIISAIVILALIWYVIQNDLHRHLLFLSFKWWLISALLSWSIMLISAWMIFTVRIGKAPRPKTLFLFPICQSLAGHLFPLQGSVAFSAIYFKHVYNLSVGQTIGINALLVLVYIILLGVSGLSLAYSYTDPGVIWVFGFIAVIPIISLFIPRAIAKSTREYRHQINQRSVVSRLIQFSEDVQTQWKSIFKRPGILALFIAKLFLYLFWFSFLNYTLDMTFTTHQLLYLVFAVEASLIFKITPGNWGISQASGGIALALIDAPVTDGVLLITVAMLSVILLNLALGYFAIGHFTRQLSLQKRTNLYKEVSNLQTTIDGGN